MMHHSPANPPITVGPPKGPVLLSAHHALGSLFELRTALPRADLEVQQAQCLPNFRIPDQVHHTQA